MSATEPSKFYLTTPIYYVNARPHIGHAYTTIVADVLARRHRLLGDDTFFLTGTDEHGQKIERSAAAAAIPPQQFADQVSQSFQDLWHRMGITNDAFIRTTDPRHQRGVQKLFSELYARGFIELRNYTGAYCVSDEAFIDAPVGTPCPDCGRLLEQVTEENFFFKLSAFQLPLLDLIESNTLLITPGSVRNEVHEFLTGNVRDVLKADGGALLTERDDGSGVIFSIPPRLFENGALKKTQDGCPYVPGALRDLSISRSSFTWGVPVPEPAASAATQPHVIYVWLDALANYITALGYGSDDESLLKKFWPADLHLVGKEITRFHCVYWPAFLLALNPKLQHKSDENHPILSLEEHKAWAKDWLPKQITAHGWLLFDNSKMSKSKGNIVRTETILDAFGTLCPPLPANSVILSEGAGPHPAPQPKDPEAASATHTTQPFSTAPLEASNKPAASPLPPTTPAEASNKPAASPLPPTTPAEASNKPAASPLPPTAPLEASVKGTASAVPPSTPRDAALAAEVRPATPHERDLFASDVLRYYLLREIPFGQDGSFSFDALITRYNADLANGYGNLVSRVLTTVIKAFDGVVPSFGGRLAPLSIPVGAGGLARYVWGSEHIRQYLTQTIYVAELKFERRQFSAGRERDLANETINLPEIGPLNAKVEYGYLDAIWSSIEITNGFFSGYRPWTLIEQPTPALASIVYQSLESIRIITALLYPILPYATARVWSQLGLGDIEQAARNGDLKNLQWGGLKPGTKLGPLAPIFPRADKGLAQIMTDMEEQNAAAPRETKLTTELDPTQPVTSDPSHPAAPPRTSSLDAPTGPLPVGGSRALTTGPHPTPSHTEVPASGIFAHQPPSPTATTTITTQEPSATTQITIEDFAKIELRVAQIVVAERIPKADKLLRLEVDLGYEKRQILSGIAEFYTPEELIGRRIVVITNLAPRKMRGLESHGMLLAASVDEDGKPGKPILATMAEDIALGARLK